MAAWSTSEVSQDDQSGWLVHLYEKTVNGIRELGAVPSGTSRVMKVATPSLQVLARTMRFRDQLPPGHNPPTGDLDWLE